MTPEKKERLVVDKFIAGGMNQYDMDDLEHLQIKLNKGIQNVPGMRNHGA